MTQGSYDLSEAPIPTPSTPLVPAGYTASSWTCGDAEMTTETTVVVPLNASVVCEITNTATRRVRRRHREDRGLAEGVTAVDAGESSSGC